MNHPTAVLSSGKTGVPSAWDFFDHIHCISLTNRTDRRDEAAAQFARVGLADRVQFWLVEKHPDDSEQGIFESHMGCLRHALQAGAKTILIFEDDIRFERFSLAALQEAVTFLKNNPGWHIFSLGCFVRKIRRTTCASVVHVRYGGTTHAYAVNRGFAERLVTLPWQGVAFDDVLRDRRDEATYALHPACAFQSDSSTDNDKLMVLHRIRTMLGGMQRLQKWNEFRHYNARTLIVTHVLFVLLVLALVLLLRR